MGTRNLSKSGRLAANVVVSPDGYVCGNKLEASYSVDEWGTFNSISVTVHHALVLYQSMERVATVRKEILVRPEVINISELRLVERHAKGIIAGVDQSEARARC